jgi:hypothetical protein
VGVVDAVGDGTAGFAVGDRVGVPWLGWTCGECNHCGTGRENLCDTARFTGYQVGSMHCVSDSLFARFLLSCLRPSGSAGSQARVRLYTLCVSLRKSAFRVVIVILVSFPSASHGHRFRIMKRSKARYCTTLCAAVTVDVCFHDADSYFYCFCLTHPA